MTLRTTGSYIPPCSARMTNARGHDCCTTGGQGGQKRLEFWWDCLQNGTLPPGQNPIGWDFKSRSRNLTARGISAA